MTDLREKQNYSAFPHDEVKLDDAGLLFIPASPGMTLRDWFAGMALQGLIMRDQVISTQTAGNKSYDFADAMLEARQK
jgi:hypothetical protein